MRLRFSLFKKIIVWLLLNLLLVGAIFILIVNLSFRFEPRLPFWGEAIHPADAVARLIIGEVQEKSREERDEILKRYSEAYKNEFFIFDNDGRQIAGKEIALPEEVLREILRRPPPGAPRPPEQPPIQKGGSRILPPPPRVPPFLVRTEKPRLFWLGARMPIFEAGQDELIRATLIIKSDSPGGNGLFYDPRAWIVSTGVIAVSLAILVFSILFWLPLVRGLTRSIEELTRAAGQIAEEKFDVRVNEKRTDELGSLAKSINQLAGRLEGFVGGQKRFLGDISHELNSPLARMQFALSILEDRVGERDEAYVADVREEVELMSKLVSELLAYSKAGIKQTEIKLENVRLRALVESVVERETARDDAFVRIEIDENLEAATQPELLSRALANVVRNAVRYAGEAGEIEISARNGNGQVRISIADAGAGVPETEIDKLFEPFYRVDTDRARKTGGTGLGLAIVKTCVEACRGKVFARNRAPAGLEVVIELPDQKS